jgi:hypothetical protein
MQRAFQTALLILVLAAGGCSEDNSGSAVIAVRDEGQFTNMVLPVLQRDCGFQACHGAPERFFRVFGPGRTRIFRSDKCLNKTDPPCPFDPLTGDEQYDSLLLAQSMIDPQNPSESLLLRKPLAVESGGADHEGVDKYGRNVYRTTRDEGYRIIARWVLYEAPRMAAATTPVVVGNPPPAGSGATAGATAGATTGP